MYDDKREIGLGFLIENLSDGIVKAIAQDFFLCLVDLVGR